MESAQRYLKTIESLMVENSKLRKELLDATMGIAPASCIPQDDAIEAINILTKLIKPTQDIKFISMVQEVYHLARSMDLDIKGAYKAIAQLEKKIVAIEHAACGDDMEEDYIGDQAVYKVMRLRGVLELTKTRLDRFAVSGSEIADLRKDVECFLTGKEA